MTVSEIRRRHKKYMEEMASEDINLRYNLWGRLVLREIAYYLTWLFLRLGLSANLITSVNFLIGCVGCLLIAFGNYTELIIGALLVNFWALLDYADGQVARWNNSSSNYGRFLDIITDLGVAALLFMALGLRVYYHPDPYLGWVIEQVFQLEPDKGLYLFLGGWTSTFYLMALIISYNFERLISPQLVPFVSQLKIRGLPVHLIQMLGFNLQNVTGIVMPVLLLGAILGFLSIVLGLWALIITSGSIFLGLQMVRKARSSNSA